MAEKPGKKIPETVPTIQEINRQLRGKIAADFDRLYYAARKRALGWYTTDPRTKQRIHHPGDNTLLRTLIEIGAGKATQSSDTGGQGRRESPPILDYLSGAIDGLLYPKMPDRTPNVPGLHLSVDELRDAPSGKPVVPDPDEGPTPENDD